MSDRDEVAEQSKEHEVGIFGAIQRGEFDEVFRLVDQDRSILKKRDVVGATPVHAAFLYRKDEIAKALVERYPPCASLEYDGRLYGGENILHIAIIRRELELCRWLLERCPELLNSEAIGDFFLPAGDAYFGGFPLLFAVSSNQPAIVDLILQTSELKSFDELKNTIFLVDRFKNTALHFAVMHDLPKMYDHVLSIAEEKEDESSRPLRNWTNADNLSPLGLAAAMGKVDMFQHILATHIKIAWEYGPVICKMVPLAGLEQPQLEVRGSELLVPRPEVLALQCICASQTEPLTNCLQVQNGRVADEVQQGRLELIEVPEIKKLLDKKWEFFGRQVFHRQLMIRLGIQMVWVLSLVIPNHWRLDWNNIFTHPIQNVLIILLEGTVLYSALNRAVKEIRGIIKYGVQHSIEVQGAAAVEKSFGALFSVFYIISWALRLAQHDAEDIFASLAALVGWFYMFFFLLGFRTTGPYIIMILEIVKGDMRRFMNVFVVVLVAYAMAMYIVIDCRENPGVMTLLMHMKELLMLATGADFPFDEYMNTSAFTPVLVVSYIILVVILLLNLLIAMMGTTYSKIDENSERAWYVEKANIMAAFEKSLSVHEMQKCRMKYAVGKYVRGGDSTAHVAPELFLQVTVVDEKWKEADVDEPADDGTKSSTTSRAGTPVLLFQKVVSSVPPFSTPPTMPSSPLDFSGGSLVHMPALKETPKLETPRDGQTPMTIPSSSQVRSEYSGIVPVTASYSQTESFHPSSTQLEAPRRPSYTQPAPSRPSPTRPAPFEPSPAQSAPSRPSPTQPAPSRPSPTQPASSRSSTIQPAPSQPSPAQPAHSRPSTIQPAPSQPSPAQPEPSRPSFTPTATSRPSFTPTTTSQAIMASYSEGFTPASAVQYSHPLASFQESKLPSSAPIMPQQSDYPYLRSLAFAAPRNLYRPTSSSSVASSQKSEDNMGSFNSFNYLQLVDRPYSDSLPERYRLPLNAQGPMIVRHKQF